MYCIEKLIMEARKNNSKLDLSVYQRIKAEQDRYVHSVGQVDEVGQAKILQKLYKDYTVSISEYKKAGRQDLVDSEEAELSVLEKLMPPKMNEEDIKKVIMGACDKLVRKVTLADTKTLLAELQKDYPGITGKQVVDVIKTR